ncbi:PDZ domain-containing protein [Trichonephila clavipes]|nr:PDZ domain-containing protein [Trichonephila clavipes]
MFDLSSFADPTPLAQADISRDVLPRGGGYGNNKFQEKNISCPPMSPDKQALGNDYAFDNPYFKDDEVDHVKPEDAEKATRGLLATDLVIFSHSQVTWPTPALAPALHTSTLRQREDIESRLAKWSWLPSRRWFVMNSNPCATEDPLCRGIDAR